MNEDIDWNQFVLMVFVVITVVIIWIGVPYLLKDMNLSGTILI